MHLLSSTSIVIYAVLVNIPAAHAWGAAGHEIVATIAQIHLPKPVLNLVCNVLHPLSDLSQPTPISSVKAYPPCQLAPIAAWADQIRSKPQYRYTASLHYINAVDDAPPDECAFPGSHGWQGKPTGNVLAAIGNVTNVLKEFVKGERDVEAAEEALKFLVHWVGDMHQPLHMSGREKGGNGARVAWNGRVTNLHGVWDGLLIAQSLRTIPSNYSRPLGGEAGTFVEPHLRGAIYDPYIRRIMHEGLTVGGRLDEESRTWLDCPEPKPLSASRPGNVGWAQRMQALLTLDLSVALGMTTRPGTEESWDDETLCPFAWSKPIHALNCELPVWPHQLDLPGSHPSEDSQEAELDGDTLESVEGRPPRHPELVELDTKDYAGKIADEWVVERLLATAGVRLAGILTDIFADAAGEA